MENNSNRRLLIIVGLVLFFVVIVLVWYFFYAKPAIAPTLNSTNNPLPTRTFPARFQFLSWGNNTPSTSTTEVTDPQALPLIEVWNKPATGQTFITSQILQEVSTTTTNGSSTVEVKRLVRATSSVLLFVDRTTGYIYGYPIETGRVFQISNTIIPGVYDAYFFDNGQRVILRYFDQQKNIVVGLIASVPNVSQDGDALPLTNISSLTSQVMSIAVNQKKDEASYVVATDQGSAIYSVRGTKPPQLVSSSPFREWVLSYGGSSLYVTTRPSAYIEGATFSLPSFQSEISDKTGLMSNEKEFGVGLHSMWSNKGLVTFLSNNGDVQVLPFTTLASKCTWGKKNIIICAVPRSIPKTTEGLPDDWLQGRISFSDDLFLVDSSNGQQYPLYSFNENEGDFDITTIAASDSNDFIGFIKRMDSSLWLLNTNLITGE